VTAFQGGRAAAVFVVTMFAGAAAALHAQAQTPAPPPPPNIGPRPFVGPPDRPPVDPAAADRGRALYAAECVTCHGPAARGTERGPSLLRSLTVLNDRYGSLLVPFFQKGHPMQSGTPSASLTKDQAVDLMHFLRQRINDTLRGSDVFDVGDIVTGNAAAGQAYFTGAGRCTGCHSATGDLAGIAGRLSPVDIQQRMLFPTGRGRGGRVSPRAQRTVVVTTPAGAQHGALLEEDDFHVTFRDESGAVRVVKTGPGVTVAVTDPLQAHHELLDRITDQQIHDLLAYLVTLQ
jgi:mono/diheme cytochrome c family protein